MLKLREHTSLQSLMFLGAVIPWGHDFLDISTVPLIPVVPGCSGSGSRVVYGSMDL